MHKMEDEVLLELCTVFEELAAATEEQVAECSRLQTDL